MLPYILPMMTQSQLQPKHSLTMTLTPILTPYHHLNALMILHFLHSLLTHHMVVVHASEEVGLRLYQGTLLPVVG